MDKDSLIALIYQVATVTSLCSTLWATVNVEGKCLEEVEFVHTFTTVYMSAILQIHICGTHTYRTTTQYPVWHCGMKFQ